MLKHNLKFSVADKVTALGWTGICFRMDGLRNRESDLEFQQLKAETIRNILPTLTREKIKSDPVLAGFKRMHEAIGHSNRETVAAPEALLNMLLRTGNLPQINLLVDIYNLISVETRLALGAHDVNLIPGRVEVRFTDGTEKFVPIGTAKPKKVRAGDYAYIDGDNEILCWLEVRQVEKTKVTLETTDCFYIIQGNAETNADYLYSAASRLIELTKRFCGGTETMIYVPDRAKHLP